MAYNLSTINGTNIGGSPEWLPSNGVEPYPNITAIDNPDPSQDIRAVDVENQIFDEQVEDYTAEQNLNDGDILSSDNTAANTIVEDGWYHDDSVDLSQSTVESYLQADVQVVWQEDSWDWDSEEAVYADHEIWVAVESQAVNFASLLVNIQEDFDDSETAAFYEDPVSESFDWLFNVIQPGAPPENPWDFDTDSIELSGIPESFSNEDFVATDYTTQDDSPALIDDGFDDDWQLIIDDDDDAVGANAPITTLAYEDSWNQSFDEDVSGTLVLVESNLQSDNPTLIEDSWQYFDEQVEDWYGELNSSDDSATIASVTTSAYFTIEDPWDFDGDSVELSGIPESFANEDLPLVVAYTIDDDASITEDVVDDESWQLANDGGPVGTTNTDANTVVEDAWHHIDEVEDTDLSDDNYASQYGNVVAAAGLIEDGWLPVFDEDVGAVAVVDSYLQSDAPTAPVEDTWPHDDEVVDEWPDDDAYNVRIANVVVLPSMPVEDAWDWTPEHPSDFFADHFSQSEQDPPVEDAWDSRYDDTSDELLDVTYDSAIVVANLPPNTAQIVDDATDFDVDIEEFFADDYVNVDNNSQPEELIYDFDSDPTDDLDGFSLDAVLGANLPLNPAYIPEDLWDFDTDSIELSGIPESFSNEDIPPGSPVIAVENVPESEDDHTDDWEAFGLDAITGANLPLNTAQIIEDAVDFDVDVEEFFADDYVNVDNSAQPDETVYDFDSDNIPDEWSDEDGSNVQRASVFGAATITVEDPYRHDDEDTGDEVDSALYDDGYSSRIGNIFTPPVEDAWPHDDEVPEELPDDDGSNVQNKTVAATVLTVEDAWPHDDDANDEPWFEEPVGADYNPLLTAQDQWDHWAEEVSDETADYIPDERNTANYIAPSQLLADYEWDFSSDNVEDLNDSHSLDELSISGLPVQPGKTKLAIISYSTQFVIKQYSVTLVVTVRRSTLTVVPG